MIKRSTIVAVAALLLSLLVHFLGLGFVWRMDQPPGAQPSGGGETVTQVVPPGTTFEDLAEPAKEPEEPVEPTEVPTSDARIASETPQQDTTPDTGTAQPVEPQTAEPTTPDTGEAPEPTTVEPTPTEEVETADPNLEPPAGTDTVTDIAEGSPDAAQDSPDAPTQAPAAPTAVAPAPPVPAAVAPVPSAPVTPNLPIVSIEPTETTPEPPAAPEEPATVPPQETVEAIDSEVSDQAVAISQRPQLPTKRPTPVRRGSFGGSTTSTTTRRAPSRQIASPLSSYSRTGVDIFAQAGNGARSGQSARATGNSTTTNYAGRVLSQLNRTETLPVSGSGWAQVIFVVRANGTLASVDVIDSSGSRSINSAAKQQVRNAAPFPPPPSGKSRRLSFSYQIP